MREYKGIDIGRLVFACLIPFLHISFGGGMLILQQYVARLGVPFFFAVSGMFLALRCENGHRMDVWKKYVLKIGRLLVVWLIIDLPAMIFRSEITIQTLIFETPGYLWYLTGLLVATIPFCFIRNRKILYMVSAILYIVGTIYGEAYEWLTGGWPLYMSIFLTTRNGVFFGLPMMCIGELTWKYNRNPRKGLAIATVFLVLEITFVGMHTTGYGIMYLFLPAVCYYLIVALKAWQPEFDCPYAAGLSSSIYLVQYVIIAFMQKIVKIIGINTLIWSWITYFSVIACAVVIYFTLKNRKLGKILF